MFGIRTAFLVLVAFAGFAGLALAASLDFREVNTSPEAAGINPVAVAAGDVNGDDRADLVVSNHGGTLTVLKNVGNGNFAEPASSPEPLAGGPGSLVAADFDGDDDLDLAVAQNTTVSLAILLNDGTGNFSEPASSPETTGANPAAVAAADIDADTDVDLAVANASDDNITILKNKGGGDFRQPGSSPVTSCCAPVSVVLGDLDGDSDADLASANGGSSTVTVFKNRGTGSFKPLGSGPVSVGLGPSSLQAADFDLDADLDLATADQSGQSVTILRNKGTGKFSVAGGESTGLQSISLVAAKLDGDPDPDLAVANLNSNNVTILRNR